MSARSAPSRPSLRGMAMRRVALDGRIGYIDDMTRSNIQRGVRDVVEQVVSLAKPQRVILFGSAVDGRVGPDSDLDFLVVVSEGRNIRQVTNRLNVRVHGRPMPCDFVVVTPSILQRNRHKSGMVYGEIMEHGQEVYAG